MIAAAITGINDHLPELQTYQDIYSGDDERKRRLDKRTLLAYSGFVELAMKSTRWYLESGSSMSSGFHFDQAHNG